MRVGVIGGGIAGLTAAWNLGRSGVDVTLFEASDRLGGHTCTVEVEALEVEETGTRGADGDRRRLALDMGFIVFNHQTYPHFTEMLRHLGVRTKASDMGFSVRCEKTGLEYAGSNLDQLFAQRRNLLRWSFYRMIYGILRFHRQAPELLAAEDEMSLASYLRQRQFPQPFVDWYLAPMVAAVWSTPAAEALDFPARTLATFMHNHGMLTVDDRPEWRVVEGGSKTYVDAMAADLEGQVRLDARAIGIRRRDNDVRVTFADGGTERFDQLVIATHSDQALRMLEDPTADEQRVLGAIRYRDNDVVLHTDARFLPRRRRAWSSWNYHLNTPDEQSVQVTYYLNALQGLDTSTPYLVTLNRTHEIDPGSILSTRSMAHPVYTASTVAAQREWESISRRALRTHYCGAYWRYGFHEDGVVSGLRVARALGAAM